MTASSDCAHPHALHSETSTAVNSRAPSPTPSTSSKLKHAKPHRERAGEDLGADLDLGRRFESRSAASQAELAIERDAEKGTRHVPPTGGPMTLGAEDVDNPRNWSLGKKWAVDLALCFWTLSLTYSSTAFVASLDALERRFDLSQELVLLGVTLNVAGFAAGPLVAGPSSELFGRRPVYIVTAFFYVAFVAGVTWAPNAPSLLIFRFLAGFFGAAAINNPAASIADFTSLEERTNFTIPYAVMAFGGPTLGPLCSNFLQTSLGFKWNFYVSFIYTVLTSIAVALTPETHGPTILAARRKGEGEEVDKPTLGQTLHTYSIALKRPVVFMLFEPIVSLVCLYLSILYGTLYGFFEAFAVVYQETRGFTANEYGLTYISLGVGFLVGAVLLATISSPAYVKAAHAAQARGEKTPAEARLAIAFAGAFLAPASLFLFAWTAPFTKVHWIVPCIGEGLYAVSMVCIFSSYIPYLADIAGPMAASALAAGMTSRAIVASVFPLFSLQMYHVLGVGGAVSLLAGLTCCLTPLPFVFKRWGPSLRAKSTRLVA